MQPSNRKSIEVFLSSIGVDSPDTPMLLDFTPCFSDVNETYQVFRQHQHRASPTQYLESHTLKLGHLVCNGDKLAEAIHSQSVLETKMGSWLSKPGASTNFHRDWNLWSVLNFMFCGRKVWYVIDGRHILPCHANRILGDTTNLVKQIESGLRGYKFVQTANQCIYLPDGYYHRVATESFSLSLSMWWTWINRLRQRKSIIDPWWLSMLSKALIKPEHAITLHDAYFDRPAIDRAYCRLIYPRYLKICGQLNARNIRDFRIDSERTAQQMQVLLRCQTFEEALNAAGEHG